MNSQQSDSNRLQHNNQYGERDRKNSIGTIGFMLALIGLILGWLPAVGLPGWVQTASWVVWLAGLIFSFIGVFRVPRGLAIAGLILTFLGLILIIVIVVLAGVAGFVGL